MTTSPSCTGSRRVLLPLALSLAALLTGCVSPGMGQRAESRERMYVGWVRFTSEFALYPDEASFSRADTLRCVSGALPPDKHKDIAARLNGKRVKVKARAVPWSLPEGAMTLNNQGSPITNWCGDQVVLFASDMTLNELSLDR
jgi:hypothetical protein